ncbi:MAG: ATP-binding protein [Hyphomonadaceae bacterium]
MDKPVLRHFWRMTPILALLTAVLLVVGGLLGAWMSEQSFRAQKVEQAQAHARVLAASVGAALAFQDLDEAQRAVDAVISIPNVASVGVYTTDGVLFAGRAANDLPPPARIVEETAGRFADGFAVASMPVMQNGAEMGAVYVRLSTLSASGRWLRYIGVALLVVMAGVMVAVIAAAQRVLSGANAELTRRAEALADSNAQLSAEMAERKKAESALAQSQKMEAIGQLTGGVAHDFNNLLMVISSGLRLLESRDDPQKRAAIVASMRQAVDRGASLTKQLLAFARRQKLTPEVVDVRVRIEGMRSLLERSLREDITIDYALADDMCAVKVDPSQLELAVLNLAVNARDAMPSGGALSISAEGLPSTNTEPHGAVRIVVADTGAGMAPDVVQRAFDPFFTTKAVGEGTGLGLSQVYGFALQSGGRCEIESAPGQGTRVILTLPCTDEPLPQAAPAQIEAPPEPAPAAGDVLVVEDDDGVAAFVCEMIADLGYRPTRVENADSALNALDSGAPVQLVFSDIIMPGGMSGIDLAQEIRRRRPDLPVLLTTGYGGKEEIDAHGFAVLRKPYDRDDLGAAFARMQRAH